MKAAIVIPARIGSTRIPRKMLLNRTGLPLICHTAKVAADICSAASNNFTKAIVATDSEEIFHAVTTFAEQESLPLRAEMTRADHQSGSDRVAEAINRMSEKIDIIVNLQGDEPEIDPEEVKKLITLLDNSPQADIATLGYPITTPENFANPNIVKIVTGEEGRALYFSRAPIPYDRNAVATEELGLWHVGIYAYRRESLLRFISLPCGKLEKLEGLEQLRALENGMNIVVGRLRNPPPKGIDTPEDYEAFVQRMK